MAPIPVTYEALLPSLAVYGIILTIGYIFQHTFVPKSSYRNRGLCLDFIVTLQYVAFTLEAINIRTEFGNGAFILTLFLIGYWLNEFSPSGSCCNPNSHVINWLQNKIDITDVVLRVLAQLLGGWCAYR